MVLVLIILVQDKLDVLSGDTRVGLTVRRSNNPGSSSFNQGILLSAFSGGNVLTSMFTDAGQKASK